MSDETATICTARCGSLDAAEPARAWLFAIINALEAVMSDFIFLLFAVGAFGTFIFTLLVLLALIGRAAEESRKGHEARDD